MAVNRSESLWAAIRRTRLIALLSPASAEQCVRAYETLASLDVVLEVACRTEAALEGMAAIRDRHPAALFLAGTVLTPRQAEQAIEAGAAGIVSPDYLPAVVEVCVERDLMCVPGGLGDVGKQLARKAELYRCGIDELRERYPYQWVHKLFPAMVNAPAHLETARAWKSVYRGLAILYTGGVSAENLHLVVERDPEAVLCGSGLTRSADDPARLARDAHRWLSAIHPAADRREPAVEASRPAGKPSGGAPVVTFGELMLRLSPPAGLRLGQGASLDATFGGAEANVAVALARWGVESRFVTALPESAVGEWALGVLRSHNVDTRSILRQGSRVGVYYLEHGASQRPSQVTYDRAGSAISAIRPEQFDWPVIFDGAVWFHVSGITPALSPSAAETTAEAVRAAKQAGLTVSLDLNYRSRLWPQDRARAVITPLMEHVDILIGNEEDAARVFGIGPGAAAAADGTLEVTAYEAVARELVRRFRLRAAAVTLRQSRSASDNTWSACLYDGRECHRSRSYDVHVVDRVGAGDAFVAGLIHGLLAGRSPGEALDFAVAASCWKHTIRGDFNLATVQEIEALAAGDTAGRVRR